jgi:hypothetical protein
MTLKYGIIFLLLSALWSCQQEKKVVNQTIEAKPIVHGALMRQEDINIKPIKNKPPIKLANPSFEDTAQPGHTPKEWLDCGFASETPPDIHPGSGFNIFNVSQKPYHGNTYLGMVTRENDTWERVGQKLKTPLEKDVCYSFCIYLMRSPNYVSQSKSSSKEVNYNNPVMLKVWGGNALCDKADLLAESPKIEATSWKKYSVIFKPHNNIDHILFEAYYDSQTKAPYIGNLLLDNLSAITPCACDSLANK